MLLQLRTGITIEDGTLCLHHEQLFVKKYSFLQKVCCDPKSIHRSQVRKNLKILDLDDAKRVSNITGKSVKPGQKLCYNCLIDSKTKWTFKEPGPETESEPEEIHGDSDTGHCSSEDEFGRPYHIEALNKSFTDIGVSPLKPGKVSQQNMETYAKRKCTEYRDAVSSKIARMLDVPPEQVMQTVQQPQQCSNCIDMDRLVELLRVKLQVSPKHRHIQLLTLAPESWSIQRTAEEFDVSIYQATEAKKLKKQKGILAERSPRVGRQLPKEIEEKVIAFYHEDEYSRIMPGKKDFKSVKGPDGKRQHVQKRLLLLNLNELYQKYKARYPNDKIGLSKFCAIRPPYCITVGSRGTHSVCVCTIHQNVKLMIAALPTETNITYHDLLEKLVCSVEEKLCMVHRCPTCPGANRLKTNLEELFSSNDPDETIVYQQWLTADRTTLQDCSMPLHELVDDLLAKVEKLTAHHYIAKHQSQYLRSLKETLEPEEVIIILDFAENYSFIVQDAAQGFHWENSQATLHPFVSYFVENGQLQHLSMCVISNCLKHGTITVHRFLQDVLPHLKDRCPQIKKVHYFSDGAASQYKNYKNFCNLLCHEDDFGLQAEWNFFATSHGKNACDGVGGTVKREAAKASLQAVTAGHILTPHDLFEWATKHISNVKFFYISKEEVAINVEQQEARFSNAKTVAGTRSHHSYVPCQDGKKMLVKRVSGDEPSFEAVIFLDDNDGNPDSTEPNIELKHCEIGRYVACTYDANWWIGLRETDEAQDDVQIAFMHPHGLATSFHWPAREDICYVPRQCILRLVNTPHTPNGRQYYLEFQDKEALERLL